MRFLVKVKVKVILTLELVTKVQKWSRGIVYSFLDLDARLGWVVNATPRPLYPRERHDTHCIGGRVGPRGGLDG
jgi:hypothetical protein